MGQTVRMLCVMICLFPILMLNESYYLIYIYMVHTTLLDKNVYVYLRLKNSMLPVSVFIRLVKFDHET